jgi:hypothetical protein
VTARSSEALDTSPSMVYRLGNSWDTTARLTIAWPISLEVGLRDGQCEWADQRFILEIFDPSMLMPAISPS